MLKLPALRFWFRRSAIIPFGSVVFSAYTGLLQLPGYGWYLGPPAMLLALLGWWLSASDQASAFESKAVEKVHADELKEEIQRLSAQVLLEEREAQAQPDRIRNLVRATAPQLREEVERLASRMIAADTARPIDHLDPLPRGASPEVAQAFWDARVARYQEWRDRQVSDFRRDLWPEMRAVERELLRRLQRPARQEHHYTTAALDGDLTGPNPLTAAAAYLRDLAADLG